MDQEFLGSLFNIASILFTPHIKNNTNNINNIKKEDNTKTSYKLIETPKEIKIYVELPGVLPESINLDFFDQQLKISGKKMSFDISKDSVIHTEFTNSQCPNKLIILPFSITNKESVKVKYEHGILFIFIDKKSENNPKFTIKLN